MKQLILLTLVLGLGSFAYTAHAGCAACGTKISHNHDHAHPHAHEKAVKKSCDSSAECSPCDEKKAKSACSPCGSMKKMSTCSR